MLGTCAIPSRTALYVARAEAPRARVVVALAAMQVVAYAPVLLRLDLELLAYGLSGGATSDGSWTDRVATTLFYTGGALVRALATASTLALALAGALAIRRRASSDGG